MKISEMNIGEVSRKVGLWVLCGMVAVSLLAYFTHSAQAAKTNWYVTPTGSGNHDGQSQQNAFATLQQALDVVQPGDTIYLGDGNYDEAVVSKQHGSANAPITISGSPQAVLRGDPNEARVFELNHDHYVLDGWTINGYDGKGNSKDNYRDKLLYIKGEATVYGGQLRRGPQGVEVRNMHLLNAGGECIRLRYFVQQTNIHHNTIQNCGIHDFRFNAGGKNGEGIYVGTSSNQWGDGKNPTAEPDESNFNHIHHNVFDTQGNECVDVKEGASNNLIEYNDCTGGKDPESAGLDARGSGNIFRYNATYGHLGGGVRLGGHTIHNVLYGVNNVVYGNTIYNNASGGIKFEADPQATICGNILQGANGQIQGNGAYGSYGDQYSAVIGAACAGGVPPTPAPQVTPKPTTLPTVAPTALPTVLPTVLPTATPSPESDNTVLYMSAMAGGKVEGVRFKDEDILAFDAASGHWQLYFDGSDVGLATADVDAFARLPDGSLLLSFITTTNVDRVGEVDDSDIVRFVPRSLGSQTDGGFQKYFDGSDVGLTENGEDVNALTVLQDGRLLMSTTGNYNVGELAGGHEDLLAFTPRKLGGDTAGDWAIYLAGAAVGLQAGNVNVSGLWINQTVANQTEIYLSAHGRQLQNKVDNQLSGQLPGDQNDIFFCSLGAGSACTLQRFWDGNEHNFGDQTIDALTMTAGFVDGKLVIAADSSEDAAADDGGAEDDTEPAAELTASGETPTAYQLFLPVITN